MSGKPGNPDKNAWWASQPETPSKRPETQPVSLRAELCRKGAWRY